VLIVGAVAVPSMESSLQILNAGGPRPAPF